MHDTHAVAFLFVFLDPRWVLIQLEMAKCNKDERKNKTFSSKHNSMLSQQSRAYQFVMTQLNKQDRGQEHSGTSTLELL